METPLRNRTGLFSNIKHDLPASVVVFFVALPLCLGIALASGAPLFAGIIAGVVGGIVVGSLSGSALGVSGPAAGLAVIVLNTIEKLGAFEAFLLAVVIAGVIQIVLGFLRAGIIGYYFPTSVIKGMLTAIGIIIILKQIPHAVGYDADYEGDLSFIQADGKNTFTELISMLDTITPGAIVVCLIAMAILLVWETDLIKGRGIFKILQGALVAVIVGIIYQTVTAVYFPGLALGAKQLVSVPVSNSIGGFIGQFTMPDFSFITNREIWVAGFTMAIVASLETLLSVEATDKLDPQRRVTNTNRELLAQGTGNIVSGLIGGLPITQVILRSSANIQSGGRTKLSAILHACFLLICVATIPFVLNKIPLAVLAAILFMVGFKLAKPATFKEMYRLGWAQFLPFIVTVIGVVTTDLLMGISLGLVVAVVILLRKSFQNSLFLHLEKYDGGHKHIKMTLAEEVSFLNKGAILKELDKIRPGTEVTIDMSRSVSIDYDVQEVINNFKQHAASNDITVHIIDKPSKVVKQTIHANGEELVETF